MPNKKKPDKILLYSILALIVVGMIALISASTKASRADFGNIYGYFIHQLIYGFSIGTVAALFAYKFPYKKWQKLALPIFLFSLVLMILVFVPGIALETGGAQRWLDLGFITFQPSEFVKFAFIIYLAAWLTSHLSKRKKSPNLIPFLTLVGVLGALLMLQPDLSTFGIISITAVIMYFSAETRLRHIFSLGLIGVASFFALVQISQYRMDRVMTFLNPKSDPLGLGYQINQMLIAVGSGQIWGTGPLQGVQKNFLPLAMNDSIYAVLAEETGFIGSSMLIILFTIFLWRGLSVATSTKNTFAKFTAIGITVWLFSQAIINISAILGVFPLTGVTLPFISYGSSSLVITLMAAGLLLQLSKT